MTALGFVLAAGAVAWFGMTGGPTGSRASGPSLTVPGQPKSAAAAPAYAAVDRGNLPTRIVVPAAGVDTSIQEVGLVQEGGKTIWETAWHAAGHHLDSALPGQLGNMVITGHVSVADRGNLAVFSQLDRLSEGDTVQVYSGDRAFTYAVSKVQVVPPSAINVLRSDSNATVTLITCTHDLKNRLVVTGTLVT